MTASRDEGDFGFTVDAPFSLSTTFYMLMGSNIYTQINSSFDQDSYFIITTPGIRYGLVSQDNFTVGNTFIDLYDRFGNLVARSIDIGSGSGISFTATDTRYYAAFSAQRPGVITGRIENLSNPENNGVGQFIQADVTYNAALDFASDADNYFFTAIAGRTYAAIISSQIPDVFVKVSLLSDFSYTPIEVTESGRGIYLFTPSTSGTFELAISSNSFVSLGSYSLVAGEVDIIAPTLLAVSPVDGATNVAANSNLVLTFSETIARGTGSIEIRNGTATGSLVESFNAATSTRLTFEGNTLTIDPINGLASGARYVVVLSRGSIEDLFGNDFSGTDSYDFSTRQTFAQLTPPLISNYNVANGWLSQDQAPRHVADVNGDGLADVVGFGFSGVLVSFGIAGGGFSTTRVVVSNFGQTAGWLSDNQFRRELADVNNDGRSDIVGFGVAGTLVSLARADGSFDNPTLGIANFGTNQGWTSQNTFARTVGDVNGDGKADIIGFGQAGTLVALGNGDGSFQAPISGIANFGVMQGWTSDSVFHRVVADVNGDLFDDIIGFGQAGTLVALANGDGTFQAPIFGVGNFGVAQGWTGQDRFTRLAGDVNEDGFADIVGFGSAGTFLAFGNRSGGFSEAVFDIANFSPAQGWTSNNQFHRTLADLNNDGLTDIVGFGVAGVLAAYNQNLIA